MSGPCWSYDKDLLLETTSNILPLVGSANTSKVPAKVGRWLVSLTSPQRAAWNELGSVLTQLENTAFTFDLARFATRLAILIYPSHFVALKSLQQKNGTLNLLRDLEGFLISPSYSETRKNLQLRSRVLVPQLLKEQSIVLTVPDQN